jgi:hypothetical protein
MVGLANTYTLMIITIPILQKATIQTLAVGSFSTIDWHAGAEVEFGAK